MPEPQMDYPFSLAGKHKTFTEDALQAGTAVRAVKFWNTAPGRKLFTDKIAAANHTSAYPVIFYMCFVLPNGEDRQDNTHLARGE